MISKALMIELFLLKQVNPYRALKWKIMTISYHQ